MILNSELILKFSILAQMGELGDFAEMEVVSPAPPQQENYSDCGIFLLHYVHWIFLW